VAKVVGKNRKKGKMREAAEGEERKQRIKERMRKLRALSALRTLKMGGGVNGKGRGFKGRKREKMTPAARRISQRRQRGFAFPF